MKYASVIVLAALLALAAAECPNACSGHGTCQPKDMCSCYKNWQGNDCSEATCYFGLAHVDTPKGNLDGDTAGTIDTALNVVGSTVYPMGTYEMYPANIVANEGHYYMECSNKGLCDRETGLCDCYDGFEGTACKRAACPNACSGHGTCESVKELGLAEWTLHADYHGRGRATYTLWDADVGMGCKCDPQYFGADCSRKQCKYGVDPLYSSEDDGEVLVDLTSTGAPTYANTFKLGFYKHNSTAATGKLYTMQTAITPAVYASGTAVAKCDALITYLYAAQDEDGNLVAVDDLEGLACTLVDTDTTGRGVRYRITFDKNPGYLQTLFFYTNTVTDSAATLTQSIMYRAGSTCVSNPVFEEYVLHIKSSGTLNGDYRLKFYDVFGEDYITEPITAEMAAGTSYNYEDVCNGIVSRFTSLPNGVVSDVRCQAQAIVDSGDYAKGALVRLNFYKNPGVLKPMSVFETNLSTGSSVAVGMGTSTGEFVDRVNNKMFTAAGAELYVSNLQNGLLAVTYSDTNAASYTGTSVLTKILDKHLMLTAGATTSGTLKWMYTGSDITAASQMIMGFYSTDTWAIATNTIAAWAIGATSFTPDADASAGLTQGMVLFVENQYFTVQYADPDSTNSWAVYVDRPFGGTQIATVHGATAAPAALSGATTAIYYRSASATTSTFEYVSPCSNRGACDTATGLCTCFKGYSNDNCDTQNALVA